VREGDVADLNRIRRMATGKKSTFAVQRTPKAKKRPTTVKKSGKLPPQRLKAPRWVYWLGRPSVSLRQAALLTMGLAPEKGVVALLKNKERKKIEFRKREKELEAAYGISKWIPRANTLPRRVTVRNALEFASESGWALAKNAKNALMRARHLEPMDGIAEVRREMDTSPIEPIAGVRPLPLNTATGSFAFAVDRESNANEKSSRKEERAIQVLGAVLVLLHRAEKKMKSPRYLREDAFNFTTLVDEVKAVVAEEKDTAHDLPGLSESNVRTYLRDALRSYPVAYPKSKPSSEAEEG